MELKTGGKRWPCSGYYPGDASVRFSVAGTVAAGDELALMDGDFCLVSHRVSDWLRYEVSDGTVLLANYPVPQPAPVPPPPTPTPQEDADALMVEHEYRLLMLELGVKANAV